MSSVTPCPACGTQYDTTQMQPGQQFQCSCGAVVAVGAQMYAQRQPAYQAPQAGYGQQQMQPGPRRAGMRPRGPGAARGQRPMAGGKPGMRGAGGRGQNADPNDPNAQRYGPPRKSKTGLIVGLSIGGVVLVLLIIVIVVATGGSGVPPADKALIDKVLAESDQGAYTDEEFKRAEQVVKDNLVDPVKREKFAANVARIAQARRNAATQAMNEKMHKAQAAAREKIKDIASQFHKALVNNDKASLAALIDGDAYARNVRGSCPKNEGCNVPWEQPATWIGEVVHRPAEGDQKGGYSWKGTRPRDKNELLGDGLKHIFEFYGGKPLTLEMNITENDVTVFGSPPDAGKADTSAPTFLGQATIKGPGLPDLKIDIRGPWGGSGKVHMIYDKTRDKVAEAFALEKVGSRLEERNPRDPPKEDHSTHPGSDKPDNPGGVEPGDTEHQGGMIDFPPPAWDGKSEAKDTNTLSNIDSQDVRKAIDDLLKGNDAKRYASKAADIPDRQKAYVLGALCDILLNASRQDGDGSTRKGDHVMPVIGSFVQKAFKDWRLDDEWLAYLAFERGVSTSKEMAWRYRQAYDATLKLINEEAKRG